MSALHTQLSREKVHHGNGMESLFVVSVFKYQGTHMVDITRRLSAISSIDPIGPGILLAVHSFVLPNHWSHA